MKRGNLDHWTSINECKNLLFFSQLVNELLFDYSIPSNRISTLNSHYLCLDAMSTIFTIEEKGVPEGTLKPIVEELYEAIRNDIALQSSDILPSDFFVKQTKDKYVRSNKPSDLSYEECKNTVEALYQRFFSNNSYYESLKTEIIHLICKNETADQPSLFRLTKSLLTELINAGYSSAYIAEIMTKIFWNPSNDISSPLLIKDFFNEFSFNKKSYDVVFSVNKNRISKLSKYITRIQLSDSLSPRFNRKQEKKFLMPDPSKAFLTCTCEALDPFSAQEFVASSISIDTALYKLSDHNYQYDIRREGCLIYDDQHFYRKPKGISAVVRTQLPSSTKISDNLNTATSALDLLLQNNNDADFKSILNAIQFHSHSLTSMPVENQLLDLWSIFESVLDISNKHTTDRIQQVCKYLVPILKRSYIYSLLFQLANDIKNYSESHYKQITKNASEEFAIISNVFKFLAFDENSDLRNAILNDCNDFPLLVERIEYYSQVFSNTRSVYDFVEKHARRVQWQIMRIYRNRNLVIHNGDSMPYLDLLVENLHSYVDDFLNYSLQMLSKGHSLDSMCQELFVKECIWEKNYSANKGIPLSAEHINALLNI